MVILGGVLEVQWKEFRFQAVPLATVTSLSGLPESKISGRHKHGSPYGRMGGFPI